VNSSQHLVVKPQDVMLAITVSLRPFAHVNHIHLKLASIWKVLQPLENLKKEVTAHEVQKS